MIKERELSINMFWDNRGVKSYESYLEISQTQGQEYIRFEEVNGTKAINNQNEWTCHKTRHEKPSVGYTLPQFGDYDDRPNSKEYVHSCVY